MAMQELSEYGHIDLNNFHMESNHNISFSEIQPVSSTAPSTPITTNVSIPQENNLITPKEEETGKVYCKRCGRVLLDASSKILGMGPTCYKLYRKERDQQINLFCLKGFGKHTNDGNK